MDTSHLLRDRSVIELVKCIVDSYQRVVGQCLIDGAQGVPAEQIAAMLYEHSAVVLSHDGAADPTFTFANLAAQQLFEYSWEEFLTLHSRKSAEPDQRSSRSEMLARASSDGYIADYHGVRISSSGKRFEIRNAIIWNVSDETGGLIGQAALFDDWSFLHE